MSEPLDDRLREGLREAADFEPSTEHALATFAMRRRRQRRHGLQLGAAATAIVLVALIFVAGAKDRAGDAARQMAAPSPSEAPQCEGGNCGHAGGHAVGGSGNGDGGESGDATGGAGDGGDATAGSGDGDGGGGGGAAGGSGAYAGATTGGGDGGSGVAGTGSSGSVVLPSKVIKTSSMEVKVDKGRFQAQFDRASGFAEGVGGYVGKSQVSETDGGLTSGTLTIRIPAQSFQMIRSRLSELGKVMSDDQSGRDVSAEYVDLEARIRHAKAEEAFYLGLIDKSKSVGDMLSVQSQLGQVQLTIEQLQGQMNLLNDQAAMATINLRIFEPGAEKSSRSELASAGARAVDGFQSVVGGMVVGVGWLAPFVLAGLLFLGLRRFGRRSPR